MAVSVAMVAEVQELMISPQSVSMYGGDVVYFGGPCLLPSSDIVCK